MGILEDMEENAKEASDTYLKKEEKKVKEMKGEKEKKKERKK